MRRFSNPPHADLRYVRRPGAYVVPFRKNKVLMTRQTGLTEEYQLPGGGIDEGESQIQALHRETLEETGWTLHRLRKIGVFKRFVFMPEYDLLVEKICHIFVARAGLQIGPPSEPDHDAVWAFVPDALDVLTSQGDRFFLSRAHHLACS